MPIAASSAFGKVDRRRFLHGAAAVVSGAVLARSSFANPQPNETVAVGVIGLGRGADHVQSLLSLPNVQLKYVCDVDEQRLVRLMKSIESKLAGRPAPVPVKDYRQLLDDPQLDAVTIATPNHWHAPLTILACRAGKHVYVEKPGSHNAQEGEWMVAAARQHQRVVQMGNQRRSRPGIREGMQRLQEGAIGPVRFARCYYDADRPSIKTGQVVPIPAQLDYGTWQGPAPERPYLDNLVHYNWHWRWHWGGGELANNGIHALDLARWGLGVDYPTQISFTGGRYHFQDDQETPDTGVAVFHFGDSGCTWDVSSCHARKEENHDICAFYGDNGTLRITNQGYRILDRGGKQIAEGQGSTDDRDHFANFIDCCRSGGTPNSEIEEGQKSTLLCHLGNIAYRVGRVLRFDPATKRIVGDDDAMRLWSREYRPGFPTLASG